MNALRKKVGSEDVCDAVISDALNKGPKRVRIASREELKMEINKFKNISLRLIDEMKRQGVKPPISKLDQLQTPETGLRDLEPSHAQKDHLETQSEHNSEMSLGGDLNEGEATES